MNQSLVMSADPIRHGEIMINGWPVYKNRLAHNYNAVGMLQFIDGQLFQLCTIAGGGTSESFWAKIGGQDGL